LSIEYLIEKHVTDVHASSSSCVFMYATEIKAVTKAIVQK